MSQPTKPGNPFYALLLAIGVAFTVTTLGYVTSFVVLKPAGDTPDVAAARSPLMQFFQTWGESLMLWEAAALAGAATLAMGLDRWRSSRAASGRNVHE